MNQTIEIFFAYFTVILSASVSRNFYEKLLFSSVH